MEKSLDEIFDKIKGIKEEVDKVEFRVLNTRTHMDNMEKNMSKISKEILEGFHIVSSKVNHLEEEMKKVERLLEEVLKKK